MYVLCITGDIPSKARNKHQWWVHHQERGGFQEGNPWVSQGFCHGSRKPHAGHSAGSVEKRSPKFNQQNQSTTRLTGSSIMRVLVESVIFLHANPNFSSTSVQDFSLKPHHFAVSPFHRFFLCLQFHG